MELPAWRVFALRLTCPPHANDAVVALLHRHPAATHLVLLRGAGLEPAGDVVMVDLAREAVSEVLGELRALPGGPEWPYALENVDTTLSPYADEAERVAPGLGVDAVVWEEVQARTSEESELPGSFLALMVLSTLIAAVGVLVALLAGVAGVDSLTSAQSAGLVGVAVSVTTIPAAADVGGAAAAGRWSECGGAAAQLGVNLVALVLAGVLTLLVRRRGSRRSRSRAATT